jgi:hypothetical protein
MSEQYVPPQPVAAGVTCRLGELAVKAQIVFFYQFHSKVVLFGNSVVEVILFAKNSIHPYLRTSEASWLA